MPPIYKLVAAPHLLPGGDFKGHLETVTFIAANENETHKWWAVNVGTFEKDFTKIVSPELAQNIMTRLRQGEIVEFPNRYELCQVKGKFGGCFMD
jgi:transcriptional accessory protein Tex/SPT6